MAGLYRIELRKICEVTHVELLALSELSDTCDEQPYVENVLYSNTFDEPEILEWDTLNKDFAIAKLRPETIRTLKEATKDGDNDDLYYTIVP